ncbi:MAG: hypothetical protein WEB00_07405 [Dehalococcoidia bacterium]
MNRVGFVSGLLGVVAGVLLVSASSVVAGSGVGGVFNLGQTNTVDGAQTKLVGSHNGAMFEVTNNGTGRGISVITQSGVAPLSVNQTARVKNLNADLIDGLDSDALVTKANVYVYGPINVSVSRVPRRATSNAPMPRTSSSRPGLSQTRTIR